MVLLYVKIMAKNCIFCGEILNDEDLFCSKCGKKQEPEVVNSVMNKCPKCGAELGVNSVFCPKCGEQIVLTDNEPKDLKESISYVLDPNIQNKEKVLNWDFFKKQFLTFEGRINRQDYIFKNLFIIFITFITLLVVEEYVSEYYMDILDYIICLFAFIILIGSTIVNLSLTVRRLHDLNHSGWLSLLFAIPIVNGLLAIYLFCFKGTTGTNKYGEDLLK